MCGNVVGIFTRQSLLTSCGDVGAFDQGWLMLSGGAFLGKMSTKHFTSLWQLFVLRAFCVQVTSSTCFSILFLPAFNFHLLFPFFFAARLSLRPASLRTSLSLVFSYLLLHAAHSLSHQVFHFDDMVFDDFHPPTETSCKCECDGGRCTPVLTDVVSSPLKVSAVCHDHQLRTCFPMLRIYHCHPCC